MTLPILMPPRGKGWRRGLFCVLDPYLDMAGRNILPVGSENFATGWITYGGETISVTDYPINIPGIGDVTAKRIQGQGNGSSVQKYYVNITTGNNLYGAIYIKTLSGNCTVGIVGGTTTNYVATAELMHGTYKSLNNPGGGNMRFLTANATDVLDIVVYEPQINSLQLTPYSAPSGPPQTCLDRSNHSNHAQNGSTSGADTNDGAFTGLGWSPGTDDYLKLSQAAFDDLPQFTVITACNPISVGGSSAGRLWEKTGRRQSFSSGKMTFYQSREANYTAWRNDVIVSLGSVQIHGLSYKSDTPDTAPVLWINSIKQTMIAYATTGSGAVVSDSANDLYVGNGVAMTTNFDGTIYYQMWFNRALSDPEYLQAYNYIKRLLNQRGIAI